VGSVFTFHSSYSYETLSGCLAVLLIICGVDDLIPACLCGWQRLRGQHRKEPRPVRKSERRIAIFVPCWDESAVIADMVRHNLAAIRYQKYDIFLGVYPNDEATLEITRALAREFQNVHVAICPKPGPTSKADCLNSLYQSMVAQEKQRRVRFDTVVIHDAEDLVHPQALSLINCERERYDMVQVPVLPLPTPRREFTHAIYCEDFAEYQMLDMRARQISGSFLPSNGVGTGYSRKILNELARENDSVVFDPLCLTEDYESGLRIHRMGFSQTFCPLEKVEGEYLATREYFPRQFAAAVRQRTRWAMGNCLQSWERHGWRGPLPVKYWLWRDRRGLITNPLALLTNILFAMGMVTWLWSSAAHRPWVMATGSGWVFNCYAVTLVLQCFRLLVRMECVRRIYGIRFALLVPLRCFHQNLINAQASAQAAYRYFRARRKGQTLAWVKTAHAYPDQGTRSTGHRCLQDILLSSGIMSKVQLGQAQSRLPDGTELADYLVHAKQVSEEALSKALGLKEGVPSAYLDPAKINPDVARVLPPPQVTGSSLIPYKVDRGRLLVAGPQVPQASELKLLQRFTKLQIEFHLVTWRNFEELQRLVA
jgi:bacteriophage N4 adsorption protein B